MSNVTTVIGRRFKARLLILGMSVDQALSMAYQKALHETDSAWADQILGMNKATISSALRQQGPTLKTLKKLATVAQTSVSYLIGDTEDSGAKDYSEGNHV